MIESVGCTPLMSWGLIAVGFFIGAAFGVLIAGLLASAKKQAEPWLFWCPNCKGVVRASYEEEV